LYWSGDAQCKLQARFTDQFVFFTEQSSTIRAVTRELYIQYILNVGTAIKRRKSMMVQNCSLFPQAFRSTQFREKDISHTEKKRLFARINNFFFNATTCPLRLRSPSPRLWLKCNRLLKLGRPVDTVTLSR